MATFLFDFDGTLVDSMPSYVSVMLRILDEEGIPYGKDIVRTITPLGFAGTARYYRDLGVTLSEEALAERMQSYAIHAYTYEIEAKRGVVETLRRMKDRGDELHVLTASPHMTLDPCLKRLGLYELFTNVWSCDDFGTTKADPEIYRMAAARMGKAVEDVIFVDDNLNADKTAKEAGMTVYGIYDASSADAEAEIRAVADGYAYQFEELLAI